MAVIDGMTMYSRGWWINAYWGTEREGQVGRGEEVD